MRAACVSTCMWRCMRAGKTLSFLVPALSRLDYPPTIFTDDLQGPQVSI